MTADGAAERTGDGMAEPTGNDAAEPTGNDAAEPAGNDTTGGDAAERTGIEAAEPTGIEAAEPTGIDRIVADARGRLCPQPVLDLARLARDVPAGTEIDLLADDPAAPPDVAAWCAMRGHTLVWVRRVERPGAAGGPAQAGGRPVAWSVIRIRTSGPTGPP